MLSFDPTDLEQSLKQRALNSSTSNNHSEIVNYEDFFLHFREDTEFIVPISDLYMASWTSLRGYLWIFGYTVDNTHAGFSVYSSTPWGIFPWRYSKPKGKGGGCMYAVSFERFDSLALTINNQSSDTGIVNGAAGGGYIIVEYVTSYNVPHRREASVDSCWSRLTLIEDTTHNLTRSGIIRWKPPFNTWLIATLNDGSGRSYGGGFFGGNQLMSKGGIGFAVRIFWYSTSSGSNLKGPCLDNILQRQWIVFSQPDGTRQGFY
jgi:hypothetical protein